MVIWFKLTTYGRRFLKFGISYYKILYQRNEVLYDCMRKEILKSRSIILLYLNQENILGLNGVMPSGFSSLLFQPAFSKCINVLHNTFVLLEFTHSIRWFRSWIGLHSTKLKKEFSWTLDSKQGVMVHTVIHENSHEGSFFGQSSVYLKIHDVYEIVTSKVLTIQTNRWLRGNPSV